MKPKCWSLKELKYVGTSSCVHFCKARVRLADEGGILFTGYGEGPGPVGAACHAINKITGKSPTMLDYNVSCTGCDTSANADASIVLEFGENTDDPRANGVSKDGDVVRASVESYLNSLNKCLAKEAEKTEDPDEQFRGVEQ